TVLLRRSPPGSQRAERREHLEPLLARTTTVASLVLAGAVLAFGAVYPVTFLPVIVSCAALVAREGAHQLLRGRTTTARTAGLRWYGDVVGIALAVICAAILLELVPL